MLKIDGLHLDESKVTLAVFRRSNLPGNGVSRLQIKLANLGRGNIDVIGTRQVVVLRCPKKTKAIGQSFQNSFRENQSTALGLGLEDLKDQLLFAHPRSACDIQLLGNFVQVLDIQLFEFLDV